MPETFPLTPRRPSHSFLPERHKKRSAQAGRDPTRKVTNMATQFDTTTEKAEATEALGTIEYLDPEVLALEPTSATTCNSPRISWTACASTASLP